MAEDTTKEVEQEEPQQGNSILSNLVQMIILFWSLDNCSLRTWEIQSDKLIPAFCGWIAFSSNVKHGSTSKIC